MPRPQWLPGRELAWEGTIQTSRIIRLSLSPPFFPLHSVHMPRCTSSSTDLHLLAPARPLMVLPWWFIRETNIKTAMKRKDFTHQAKKTKNKWENKKEPTSDQPRDCQGRWNQEMKNNNTTKDGKITPKPPILKFLRRHDSWTTHHSLPLTYFYCGRLFNLSCVFGVHNAHMAPLIVYAHLRNFRRYPERIPDVA